MSHPNSKPKIDDFDCNLTLFILLDQYVLELYVPMVDLVNVQISNPLHKLEEYLPSIVFWHDVMLLQLQVVIKGLIATIFHYEVDMIATCKIR